MIVELTPIDPHAAPAVKLPPRPVFGAPDPLFGARLSKYNRRRELARKRALFADTKANRKAYGVPSANFRFTPLASTATDLPPWLAAWPAAITDSVSK